MADKNKKFTYDEYADNNETLAAKDRKDSLTATKPGEFTYNDYTPSDTVTNAYNQLQQLQKPGAYQSNWQQSIDDTLGKILNRDKFSYDVTGDALYQQYKDQYVNQGKMAMMDTMGQAQAATGGYGNSYAQSVGQQAYQGYLQQLNDKVPELYQLALDKYNQEGQELYNQYGLFADRENTDYGRYRDTVSDYNTERGYLTDAYNNERSWDYGLYSDSYNRAYNQHRDSVNDWQFDYNAADSDYWNERNFGYGMYSDNRDLAHTEFRNEIADDQWGKTHSLNEAQIAASIGDNSKLKALGYDTSKMTTTGGGNESEKPSSLFGEYSAEKFTEKMAEAAEIGNKENAMALVIAAGYSDAAWAIYDQYFGTKTKPKVSTGVYGGNGGGGGGSKLTVHKIN